MHNSRVATSQGAIGTEGHVNTIGSIPMRNMPINISITKDVEAHGDASSGMDFADGYDVKAKHSDEGGPTVR